MLKLLLRVRLRQLLWIFTGAARKKKAQSKGALIAFSGLMLFSLGALGSLFWNIFDTLALPFHMAGVDWLYFSMAALMAFAIMFVGSVFAAKAELYEARDNDLLLSMPIKPGHVLLSRMFPLWVIATALDLVAAVPMLLVWGLGIGFSGPGLASALVIFALLLPLFALAVSAVFGWLLSAITARYRSPMLVTLLSLAFLGAYMVFAARLNVLLTELAQNPAGAADALGVVAPLYWAGIAAAEGSMPALGKLGLAVLAIFGLTCVVLSKTFLWTATRRAAGNKIKYVERERRVRRPQQALFIKELSRFSSSPAYMLNCGLGAFMPLAGACVLAIKAPALKAMPLYPMLLPFLAPMLVAGLCFMAGMVMVSAPSVSLEGKSLWIAKSLPVEPKEILRANLRLHMVFGLPPILIASAVAALVLEIRGLMLVCLFALPVAFCVFAGLLGLAENLRHPSFDWANETQAVKSGLSVLLTMLVNCGLAAAMVLAGVFLGDTISMETIGLVFLAVLAAACVLLYRWLMSRGTVLYVEL